MKLQPVSHPSLQCVSGSTRAMCWFPFPLCTHVHSSSPPLCLQVQQDAGCTACVWTAAPAGLPSASNCGLWWVLIKLQAATVNCIQCGAQIVIHADRPQSSLSYFRVEMEPINSVWSYLIWVSFQSLPLIYHIPLCAAKVPHFHMIIDKTSNQCWTLNPKLYISYTTGPTLLQIKMLISFDQNNLRRSTLLVWILLQSRPSLNAQDVINDVPSAIKPRWIHLLKNLVVEHGGKQRDVVRGRVMSDKGNQACPSIKDKQKLKVMCNHPVYTFRQELL